MSYTPQPGSTAFRVIAYLESLPKGTEVMTSAISEALRVEARNITPCLETALASGLLFRRQRDTHVRSPVWWSLVDHSKDAKSLDAGRQPGGEAAQAPHNVEPGPMAASTPTNGRPSARRESGPRGSAAAAGDLDDDEGKGGAGAEAHAGSGGGRSHRRDGFSDSDAERAGAGGAGVRAQRPDASHSRDDDARGARHGAGERGAGITHASPRVGATGAGQPADAGPAGGHDRTASSERCEPKAKADTTQEQPVSNRKVPADGLAGRCGDEPTRFALWSDGTLHIQRPLSGFVLTVEETRELAAYLDAICLDVARGEGGAC